MLICVTRARAFPPFWWTRRAFSLPSQLVPSHGASSVITLRSVPSAKLPRAHPRRQSKSACLLTDLLTRHQPPRRTDLLSRHQPRHMRRACVATPLGGGLVRAPVWGLARVRVRVRVKVRARARVRVRVEYPSGRDLGEAESQPRHMRRACVATPIGGGLVRAPPVSNRDFHGKAVRR